MAELKLPFSFPPGMEKLPSDQVQENFETLRKLVSDLDSKIDSFTGLVVSGTFTNTNKLETDSSGNVNQPSQPSFLATTLNTGAVVSVTGTINPFPFIVEVYDIASNFDTVTSTFTSPVTGKYYFGVFLPYIVGVGDSTNVTLRLVTSNRTFAWTQTITPAAGGNTFTAPISVVAEMDANDTAVVTVQGSGGTTNWSYVRENVSNCFTGTLIN